jgi:hypothetical protein
MDLLPLFPLNTVLFPGQTLPLHIFEERYRLMIGRCIDERAPFGVLLIKDGEEVGRDAEPHGIGTTAYIARVQRLPDGRMNLIAVGDRRLRVVALDRNEPYLRGEVAFLQSIDDETAEAKAEAGKIAALFGEHHRLVMAMTGQWTRALRLPGDPGALADFVAWKLEAPVETKQELLETLSVPACLRREADLLGERIRSLTERWAEKRQARFAGAALN